MHPRLLIGILLASASLSAQESSTAAENPTALTVYSENFAVASAPLNLDLHPGSNDVSTTNVTAQVESESVVLRDPSAKASFQVVEQTYDDGILNQEKLLRRYEGKTLDFIMSRSTNKDGIQTPNSIVQGKILRAPQTGVLYPQSSALVEVNGQMQFEFGGIPLFPASTDESFLKPTLHWQIESGKAQKIPAELTYITGGIGWEATYNFVVPDSVETTGKTAGPVIAHEERAAMTGWASIRNQSGADFPRARVKLMAGDVAKIGPRVFGSGIVRNGTNQNMSNAATQGALQNNFEDFHLYDLNRTISLLDGEVKQVQFMQADGVTLSRSYSYDGAQENRPSAAQFNNNIITQQNYGVSKENVKVQAAEELADTKANHLGEPLPAGRLRLYRRDAQGQTEFIGESVINHTAPGGVVKISTGSAFDVTGSRRQTDFSMDQGRRTLDESFEVKITNQSGEAVRVNVLEHLYRGDNWDIQRKSVDFTRIDSHSVQFPLDVPAKGEAALTYTVRYTW